MPRRGWTSWSSRCRTSAPRSGSTSWAGSRRRLAERRTDQRIGWTRLRWCMGEFSVLRPEAQPHPRALAIAFLADTRRALGLSREEFAGRLAAVLQEPVSEAQVREWEESEAAAQPGDV